MFFLLHKIVCYSRLNNCAPFLWKHPKWGLTVDVCLWWVERQQSAPIVHRHKNRIHPWRWNADRHRDCLVGDGAHRWHSNWNQSRKVKNGIDGKLTCNCSVLPVAVNRRQNICLRTCDLLEGLTLKWYAHRLLQSLTVCHHMVEVDHPMRNQSSEVLNVAKLLRQEVRPTAKQNDT